MPALLHMLKDPRWFAARNAAELLGEMQVAKAEQPLTELLRHADERVRRSAANALMRLGTTRAMQARHARRRAASRQGGRGGPVHLQEADDGIARGRHHALADSGTPEAVEALRALQGDKDSDVRAAATLSLGRLVRRATTSVRQVEQ